MNKVLYKMLIRKTLNCYRCTVHESFITEVPITLFELNLHLRAKVVVEK